VTTTEPDERPRTIIFGPGPAQTVVGINENGQFVGQEIERGLAGEEFTFKTRQDLVRRWDDSKADELIEKYGLKVTRNGRLTT